MRVATAKRALGWVMSVAILIEIFGNAIGLHLVGVLVFFAQAGAGAYLLGRMAAVLITEGRFPWE